MREVVGRKLREAAGELTRRDLLFFGFAEGLALLLLLSWSPTLMGWRGDEGFTYMAHYHFAQGTPWGTTTLHTTGPWAMLRFSHYMPETYGIMLAAEALIATCVALILSRTASRHIPHPIAGVALITVSIWLFFHSDDAKWFFLLLCAPLFVPDFRARRTSPTWILYCALLGFMFHVKGTFLIAVLVLAVMVTALELAARKVPLHAVWIGLCVVFFNWLGRSELKYIPGYVEFVLGGTQGNPETFSALGPVYQPVSFLIVAALFLLVVLRTELVRRGRIGWIDWLAYAATAWMVYRTGFARQDSVHIARSASAFLPFVGVYIATHWQIIRSWWRTKRVLCSRWFRLSAVAGGAALAMPFGMLYYELQTFHPWTVSYVATQTSNIYTLVTEGLGPLHEWHEVRKGVIRRKFPLPDEVTSPVGVYGQRHTPVLAHELENEPFPIVSAYEIWNPRTVEQTVRYLYSDRAPKYVIMTSTGPSSRVAAAFSELYETIQHPPLMVLRRRREPLQVRFQPAFEATAHWNQPLPVPEALQGQLLNAKIRYRRTLLNKLITFAYQPVPAYIVLHHEHRIIARIRLNRMLAPDGLILATMGYDNWDSRTARVQRVRHRLLSDIDRPNRDTVTAISFQVLPGLLRFRNLVMYDPYWLIPTSNWSWYFEDAIDVTLERVTVESGERSEPTNERSRSDFGIRSNGSVQNNLTTSGLVTLPSELRGSASTATMREGTL